MARKNKTTPERIDNLPTDWAIITPSYAPDFERCSLLCRSIDTFVTGSWHHYIIVSTSDLEQFSVLASPRRSIVLKETILPSGLHYMPRLTRLANFLVRFIKFSLWFSWSTGFMVGWQVQQIIKIEMARSVEEIGVLCCDSDVFFVRPCNLNSLIRNSRFRFYKSEMQFERDQLPFRRFITSSAQLLGLKGNPFPSSWYVDNVTVLHRPTIEKMCAHITALAGRDWKLALARWYNLSEYTLYGLFVDHVLKDRSLFDMTHDSLTKTIWYKTDMDDAALTQFCSKLSDTEVTVGVQSFAGVDLARIELQFALAMQRHQKATAGRS